MLTLLLLTGLSGQATAQEPMPMVVTAEWLAAHLGEPGLVVLHVGDDRSRPTYDAGHIPGARFVHPWKELAAPSQEGALNLELPPPELLQATLESKGISNASRVVVYAADGYNTPTTRTYLTLEYAGFGGRIAVLDGGLEAWKAAGRPVTAEVPTPAKGSLTLALRPDLVVDAVFVHGNVENPKVAVIDARNAAFYNGRETGQGRNGHIPGARSIPFPSIIDSAGRFKDQAMLRTMFAEAGAEPGDRVVTYCHIGQQATLVWFAARLAGYDAVLYDGSFQDWAKRAELPVVTPAGPEPRKP
ncbi:MAG: sulfurtransferase [Gemmatimonadales bacterium]